MNSPSSSKTTLYANNSIPMSEKIRMKSRNRSTKPPLLCKLFDNCFIRTRIPLLYLVNFSIRKALIALNSWNTWKKLCEKKSEMASSIRLISTMMASKMLNLSLMKLERPYPSNFKTHSTVKAATKNLSRYSCYSIDSSDILY